MRSCATLGIFILVAAAQLAAASAGAQPSAESGDAPAIRDVRPPSCFTPGPEGGLSHRGHAYGIFEAAGRGIVAVTAGRDSTRLLQVERESDGSYVAAPVSPPGGHALGVLQAARTTADSLVLWTEERRLVLSTEGWESGINPEPQLFRHHGSARTGTPIGIGFADFWVPMSRVWQWMTDLESGGRLLLWNERLSANNYDGPDAPGIVEVPVDDAQRSEDSLPPFHPLPAPTVELYERTRLDTPLDSLQRENLYLEVDFGAWQLVAGEVWFGITFYQGEGIDGVGGYGRFDPGTARYAMHWGTPAPDRSVSALYHDGTALWLGLMGRHERSHPGHGVARVDLQTDRVQIFEVPGVVTVLCPALGELFAGSREGLFRFDRDGFVPVLRTPDGTEHERR